MGSFEIADFVVESFKAAAAAVLIMIAVVVGVVYFVGVPAGILLFVALSACAGPMTENMQQLSTVVVAVIVAVGVVLAAAVSEWHFAAIAGLAVAAES